MTYKGTLRTNFRFFESIQKCISLHVRPTIAMYIAHVEIAFYDNFVNKYLCSKSLEYIYNKLLLPTNPAGKNILVMKIYMLIRSMELFWHSLNPKSCKLVIFFCLIINYSESLKRMTLTLWTTLYTLTFWAFVGF